MVRFKYFKFLHYRHKKGWADTMKKHSGNSCKSKPFDECDDVYPIRQFSEKNSEEMNSAKNETKRIKSCDYAQWDKYDPGIRSSIC